MGLGRFQRQHLNDVGPAELCSQRRHNPEIGELLGKLHHAAQVARLEAAPVRAATLAAEPERASALGRPGFC